MLAWLLALLNPLNWVKIWSIAQPIVDLVKSAFGWIREAIVSRKEKQEQDQVDQVADEVKKANEVKDDAQRIAEKAKAGCDLEKVLNPDSDCDSVDGGRQL